MHISLVFNTCKGSLNVILSSPSQKEEKNEEIKEQEKLVRKPVSGEREHVVRWEDMKELRCSNMFIHTLLIMFNGQLL